MSAATEAATPLPAGHRLRLLLWAGLPLLLLTLAAPFNGLMGIPVVFFLKNRLHLSANQTAQFNLWVSLPLYLAFLPGLLRDRWNPFGAGDRGHIILFGLTTGAVYGLLAVLAPSYAALMAGLMISTATVLVGLGAANGIFSAMGQNHAMPGQAGSVMLLAGLAPTVTALFLGGALSQWLERFNGAGASQSLFLVGAALLACAALSAALGPKALYTAHDAPRAHTLRGDVVRLLRHWPVWPSTLLLLLWNFQPAFGTALTYHLSNHLHANDTQVGAVFAMFWAGQMAMTVIYSFACQRVRLSRLIWWSTLAAIPSQLPFLIMPTPTAALAASLLVGLMSGFASAAYIDLAIRSSPKGLEGAFMMLILNTKYYISGRFGDLWGTYLYDAQGGYRLVVIVTTLAYALIPVALILTPRRLLATSDGQPA